MFKEKLNLVPHLPGSYQMKNDDNTIIYVGKAKDLRLRLASYFNGKVTGKTLKLVSEIKDFEYIITSSELEAFLLELNLIKKYNPKYNILLTDDKTYPYIEYISKPHPKVKVSRYLKRTNKNNKNLFGPFPNGYAARKIVELLNRFYPLKKCDGKPKNICLYYDIKECHGYCTKEVNPEEIVAMEKEILSFLNGNDTLLKNKIKEKITFHSESLNYEMALELKKELDYINIILDKQKIELKDLTSRDIFGYYFDKGYISIQTFYLRNGKLLGGHNDILPVISSASDELEYYIVNHYETKEHPKEVLTVGNINLDILSRILNISFKNPTKGPKKKLLEMAKENAKINFENEFERLVNDENKRIAANDELKDLLGLKKLDRIEIFDNSNLFGSFSVSGMVVFKNGLPAKKEYRKFKISLEENDDYHMMKEVIYRRYYRLLIEKNELPDLIIVDGGRNQINACKEILGDLNLNIRVCGLKKNSKHKTSDLLDGNTYETIPIERTSNLFHYLTRIQDEVHRYTINYHRQIRGKGSIASILEDIEGIGNTRKKELLKKFGSLKKMKEAPLEELTKIIPLNIAENLKKFLNEKIL